MRQYIVDGSCKGICIGAGIVGVDAMGFMNMHHFHRLHLDATPMLAEIYALECALNIIQERNPADRHLEIVTDSDQVQRIFGAELLESSSDTYIQGIKNRVIPLTRYIRFRIRRQEGVDQPLTRIAHLLSRNYLDDPIIAKVIQQSLSPGFNGSLSAIAE